LETADLERRQKLLAMLDVALIHVPAAESLVNRAESLCAENIKGYDALHLAAAEAAGASYFITTDDRLLKRAQRAGNICHVRVINPTDWPPQIAKA
jgi:predicted nucleic acid-binding protein